MAVVEVATRVPLVDGFLSSVCRGFRKRHSKGMGSCVYALRGFDEAVQVTAEGLGSELTALCLGRHCALAIRKEDPG